MYWNAPDCNLNAPDFGTTPLECNSDAIRMRSENNLDVAGTNMHEDQHVNTLIL